MKVYDSRYCSSMHLVGAPSESTSFRGRQCRVYRPGSTPSSTKPSRGIISCNTQMGRQPTVCLSAATSVASATSSTFTCKGTARNTADTRQKRCSSKHLRLHIEHAVQMPRQGANACMCRQVYWPVQQISQKFRHMHAAWWKGPSPRWRPAPARWKTERLHVADGRLGGA